MKRSTQTRIIAALFIAFFSVANLNAATYTTMNNGNFNDIINVWSLDGGFTSCGCAPANPTIGNDLVINHNIVLVGNLSINVGSNLTLSSGGSISGPFDLTCWNPGSQIDIMGIVSTKRLIVDLSGIISVTGGIVSCTGLVGIGSGTLNIVNGYVEGAGPQIASAAGVVNLSGSAKLYGVSSNLTNDGTINIDATSCMQSNGNIKNNGTGIINGTGSVNSGGNINNSGTWDVLIKWCALGTGLGLPSPEDCAGSDAICNAITILPIELVSFTVEAVQKNYIQLDWATASESNNSHFILFSSQDGREWKNLGRIEGVGNSTITSRYSFQDFDVRYGATYYKLIQYDFDNESSESDVISVLINGEQEQISVYPNPIKNYNVLTIANLEKSIGQINILNISGQVIATKDVEGYSSIAQVQITDLLPGIYFVKVEQLGAFKTTRLVITE